MSRGTTAVLSVFRWDRGCVLVSAMPVLCFVPVVRTVPWISVPLPLPLPTRLLALFVPSVVTIPSVSSLIFPSPWTLSPLDQTLLDLRDLGTWPAKRGWILKDQPGAGLLTPLKTTGSPRARAGAPLAPLAHLTVNLWGALHEFVIGLVVLRTDMVAPPVELVQPRSAVRAHLTVQARFALHRAPRHTLPLYIAPGQAVGTALQTFAQVEVEARPAARAEVLVEARVALGSALCAGVSLR